MTTDTFETNDQLREAYERQLEVNKGLTGKLSSQAFIDAGFPDPESKQRQVIEKHFEGDRTDAAEIASYAKDEFGFDPDTPAEPEKDPEVPPHVDPAPTKVADIRSDELDATADDASVPDEVTETVNALLQIAIEHGEGNQEQIEAAMAAELQGRGFMPDRTYTGAPLVS